MALYTEPFTAVLDNVYPKIQFTAYHNKENTLMLWLKQHCSVPFQASGEYFRVPVQYGHTDDSTTVISGYETLSTTAITDQDHFRLAVSGFMLPIIGSNWECEVLAGGGKNRVFDYWLAKTQARAKAAQRILSIKLWGDDNGTSGTVCGMNYHVDKSDTTYQGQTRSSSNTYGEYPQEDTSTTTITWPALENLYMKCDAMTDLIITSKEIYGYLWALRQPQERYNPDGGGKEFGAVGAPVIHFNHIPIVWDNTLKNANIANSHKQLYLLSHSDGGDKHFMYFTHNQWDLSAEKVMEKTKDQEVKVGRIKWAGQLMCANAQYQGRFDAITA